MADDKTIQPDGAADQRQQEPPATDKQQEPAKKNVIEIKLNMNDATYLPGENKPAEEVIKAAAEQDAEQVKSLLEFASKLDSKAMVSDLLEQLRELTDELKELQPYIDIELQKPEYAGKTFAELRETTEDGQTLFTKLILAARAARAADIETAPHVTAKKTSIVEYPLDKPNSIIWNLIKETRGDGQLAFNMAKYGSKQHILTYYSINFDGLSDELKITKRLQPFDKLVYIAVSALFNAGNNVITLSQIYYAMGYTGKPGTRDLEKINNAVTKMTTARITFDNEQEAKKYKYNHFKYDGSLLPLERGTAIINGQLADAALHIFREPPLISFAKQRRQITTLDIKLLQAPISKTDANLQIQDYLLERISKEKNGRGHSCRILYKTLFNHIGIADKPKTNTERQQRKRIPGKIKRYLDHYQKTGFISKYTIEKDGITIYW